ncbi:MAG: polyamine aminopropyltransferase [Bacillota bacterium]
MELWYTEKQTPALGLSLKVKETLLHRRTAYQEIAVLDTLQCGRMLVLDGMVQTSVADEFFYHEMITHVPLRTHPAPCSVLVIGGGDGGVVREISRYPQVEKITLVEIDAGVVEAARRYLPEISYALDDPRLEIVYQDGREYIFAQKDAFDVVIVDSTEPVAIAEGLFGTPFYQGVFHALKEGGVLVAQTESPLYNRDLLRATFQRISAIFPRTFLYLCPVPTYPSGLWSFTLATKIHSPLEPAGDYLPAGLRYYSPEIHCGSFALPPFVREMLEMGIGLEHHNLLSEK